uniref:Uncharacterized protein n=1 Tax=Knipowitschia caucasica TaxID=637954 RepID=A0AAV2J9A4_KNICA
MPDALTLIKNRTEPRLGQLERTLSAEGVERPAWVIGILASVLIFTTVVDVLGNLLVIISVFRNRKLRNSGKTRCVRWMMKGCESALELVSQTHSAPAL